MCVLVVFRAVIDFDFVSLKTSEEIDEVKNLANFKAGIDLNFEWREGEFLMKHKPMVI